MARITRRAFVGDLAVAGLAVTIVPRHVLGRGFVAPSDKLNVAVVGAAGRGRDNLQGVAREGENIYALCDVDWRAAERSFAEYPKAKRYRDYREMLSTDGKNIDAVVVSTPDHTHAVITAAALRAGKHVYCEKPLTRTISETKAIVELARRTPKAATQMGNQGHALEGTRVIRELVESGAIGTVKEIHYWTNRPIWPQAIERPTEAFNPPPTLDWNLWLGPAPERPYAPAYAPFRWRGWWDFGTGALGDIACHAFDAAFWTLDLGYPSRIEAETSRLFPETAPRTSRIIYDFPAKGARGPIRVVWRDGELSPPRPEELPPEAAWPNYYDGGHQLWYGSDGMLIAEIYGERPVLLPAAKQAAVAASPPEKKYPRPGNPYAEWITAAKAGKQPGSSFAEYSGPLTQMVLIGNLAVRMGRAIDLDPATGVVTNTVVPPELLGNPYRRGWNL